MNDDESQTIRMDTADSQTMGNLKRRVEKSKVLVLGADMGNNDIGDITRWSNADPNYIGISGKTDESLWSKILELEENKYFDWNYEQHFLHNMEKILGNKKFKLIIVDKGTRSHFHNIDTVLRIANKYIDRENGLLIYEIDNFTNNTANNFPSYDFYMPDSIYSLNDNNLSIDKVINMDYNIEGDSSNNIKLSYCIKYSEEKYDTDIEELPCGLDFISDRLQYDYRYYLSDYMKRDSDVNNFEDYIFKRAGLNKNKDKDAFIKEYKESIVNSKNEIIKWKSVKPKISMQNIKKFINNNGKLLTDIQGGNNRRKMMDLSNDNSSSILILTGMATGGILSTGLYYILLAIIIFLTIILIFLIKKKFYNKKYCNKSHNYYHQYSIPILN